MGVAPARGLVRGSGLPRALCGEQVSDRLPPVSSDLVAQAALVPSSRAAKTCWPRTNRVSRRRSADATCYLFSELLFWTVRRGSAGGWPEITPQGLGTTFGTATLVDAPFDWNAGLRIGMGYQDGGDGYDVKLCYTNFQTQATNEPRAKCIRLPRQFLRWQPGWHRIRPTLREREHRVGRRVPHDRSGDRPHFTSTKPGAAPVRGHQGRHHPAIDQLELAASDRHALADVFV